MIVIVFGMLVYLIGRGLFAKVKNKKQKQVIWIRELLHILFVLYMLMVVSTTLFPLRAGAFFEGETIYGYINLMPLVPIFKKISQIGTAYSGDISFMIGLIIKNVGGNILLLMPLGFFAPLLLSPFTNFKKTILLGFIMSISIEVLQFMELLNGVGRIVDVNDVIFNVLGTGFGYLLYKILCEIADKYQIKPLKSRVKKR